VAAASDQALLEAALSTPAGQRKDLGGEMAKAYNPKLVEAAWYAWWEKCGFFTPANGSSKPKFVIVIPPPNVTGALHIGHALTNSIQDTIVRWRRMGGYETLWVPGTDHAGIATQTVVEKKLLRERGVTRQQLGREAFLKEVFVWKEQYGDTICSQLRRLGSSLDWSRERFTMDAMLSEAVQAAFIQLHSKGLIYRENRLVNWCCALKTAISDIEVDYVELTGCTKMKVPGHKELVEFGAITSFAYKLEDGSEIVVATTRPETMLGDTAVAVHPEDPRYTHLHGKFVLHPFVDRRIPIITDAELVDMSFGTGAVKITPAHDPNDFASGKRHSLEFINILSEDGKINETGGAAFCGMLRFEARTAIVAALEAKGLLRGKADNPMRLGLCSRSKDVIEPMMKPQWWVSCAGMAADAAAAVRSGEMQITPVEQNATWFRWLDNIRDWCVSRQLWWGHRIPAYYILLEEEASAGGGTPGGASERLDRWVVAADAPSALAAAQLRFPGSKVSVSQDEDVLDTWFSSGIFPFSVFGWPNQTADLRDFYPTSLLETGHDILFFWVARMVMMGLALTGTVPFKQVYLHAMVRDAHGRKMSKSLGNVIDPVHVIEGISLPALHATLESGNLEASEVQKAKAGQTTDFPDGIAECGTDALRFALVAYTSQGRDINLDIQRVVGYRHWCNKLWNATRFAMMNLGEGFRPAAAPDVGAFALRARWIMSRLNQAIATVNRCMEKYDFSGATTALYAFWQYELCDVYIELVKPVTSSPDISEAEKRSTLEALFLAVEAGLRLLHPFMPFVTEELWQRLPRAPAVPADVQTIMLAPYPTASPAWADEAAEADMEQALAAIKAARSLRAAYGLLPKARPGLFLLARSDAAAASAGRTATEVRALSSSESVTVVRDAGEVPQGCAVEVVDDALSVYLHLRGAVDARAEIDKLHKKIALLTKSLQSLERQAAAEDYERKVPPPVRADNADKMVKLATEIAAAETAIADFSALL